MNLLPYARALLDVSAEKGEDATSSCAGFKDLSHWLKFMKGDFAYPAPGCRLDETTVASAAGKYERWRMSAVAGRVHDQVVLTARVVTEAEAGLWTWLTRSAWCTSCTSSPYGCQRTVPAYAAACQHDLPRSQQ